MEVTFTCPHCGEGTLIDEEFVGQSGECRACGQVVTVPLELLVQEFAPDLTLVETPQSTGGGSYWIFVALLALVVPFVALAFKRNEPRLPRHLVLHPEQVPSAARIQLQFIGTAFRNYHVANGAFPRAHWVDDQGRRTQSWRMQLLPYMASPVGKKIEPPSEPADEDEKKRFRRSEGFMYHTLGHSPAAKEHASFRVVTGPGTMFEEGKDLSLSDCTDDPSSTILVVQVKNCGVNWDEPGDLDIRDLVWKINASDDRGLGSADGKGAHVLMVDGSVRYLTNSTLESTLRAMMTRGGGESNEIQKVGNDGNHLHLPALRQ